MNELSVYGHKVCARCGRSYPETILNIEGVIHHGCTYLCCDRKSCHKHEKKSKKKIKNLDLSSVKN